MKRPSNPTQIFRNAYASTNVTTGAWVEIDAATDTDAIALEIFDSSGQTLKLGVGAAGSEVDLLYIVPGGNGLIPVHLAEGLRLSVIAVSGNATSGELIINFYR